LSHSPAPDCSNADPVGQSISNPVKTDYGAWGMRPHLPFPPF